MRPERFVPLLSLEVPELIDWLGASARQADGVTLVSRRFPDEPQRPWWSMPAGLFTAARRPPTSAPGRRRWRPSATGLRPRVGPPRRLRVAGTPARQVEIIRPPGISSRGSARSPARSLPAQRGDQRSPWSGRARAGGGRWSGAVVALGLEHPRAAWRCPRPCAEAEQIIESIRFEDGWSLTPGTRLGATWSRSVSTRAPRASVDRLRARRRSPRPSRSPCSPPTRPSARRRASACAAGSLGASGASARVWSGGGGRPGVAGLPGTAGAGRLLDAAA